MKKQIIKTPSEFYRMRRPENFSDSSISYETGLTKEVLAFELEKISVNQKQDLFESFCRRIVEKVITPNIIPQTGPTGGGDGKTDAETYPVSNEISDRWFVPENGWNKDEKWAFAFSAKKTWKSKAENDIKNILSTERDYTRIYFVSNQTIPSRKRKDAQDQFMTKYGVDVVILDGEWLLQEVFKNNFIDIAVDSLNLSTIYKNKVITKGANDAEREKILKELEDKINNPSRYSEYDYQKVEDALEAAILARKLEKPRGEIEGKFDRAVRFCKKLNFDRHWIRIHYQKAWTYLYYFDDYPSFINEFKNLKGFISVNSSSDGIELYVNLFNSLRGFCASNCNLNDYQINLKKEKEEFYSILETISKDKSKVCKSLIADIDLCIQYLMDSMQDESNPDYLFERLYENFSESKGLIEFPFESYNKMLEEIGILFPNNIKYDQLVDLIASIAEKRSSELTSGMIFLQRGGQKYVKNYKKESIVYFGKAILKLAKEESEHILGFALRSLAHAFSDIGLHWAANNCFVSANFFAFKPWHQQGKLDKQTFECTRQLAINELLIGRIPSFFIWYELLKVISNQIEINEKKDDFPTVDELDAFLSVRLANTTNCEKQFTMLPDILDQLTLWSSQNMVLFRLGYANQILEEYNELEIKTETELHDFMDLIANQPFREQMIHQSNFLSEDEIVIESIILGCVFKFSMQKDIELILAAETFAAFFENYLSTSIKQLGAKTEEISIRLIRKNNLPIFEYNVSDSGAEYQIEISKFSFPKESFEDVNSKIVDLTCSIIANNFIANDVNDYFENLYKTEEINERLAFVYEHRNFTINLLGDKPKIFFQDWSNGKNEYKLNRNKLTQFNIKSTHDTRDGVNPETFVQSRHNENRVVSIIIDKFWDQAKWKGFGPFFEPRIGFGFFLAFENGDAAKQIFNNWIKRFGKNDNDDIIKITIIKGVNIKNPYWYKVHITANINSKKFNKDARFYSVTARYHQMTPSNSENINRIEQIIASRREFLFCPAEISEDGKDIMPLFEYGIIKRNIDIKNAWELGFNEPACVVIHEDDEPIIPSDISNAPVQEVLKKRRKK